MDDVSGRVANYFRSNPLKLATRLFVCDKLLLVARVVVMGLLWQLYIDDHCDSSHTTLYAATFTMWCLLTHGALCVLQLLLYTHMHRQPGVRSRYASGLVFAHATHWFSAWAAQGYFGRQCFLQWAPEGQRDSAPTFCLMLLASTATCLADVCHFCQWSSCEDVIVLE